MKTIITFTLSLISVIVFSQNVTNVDLIKPEGVYENIHIKKISSDKNTTSFVIWIKEGVKAHKHVKHSENIYVVSGTGIMTMGEKMIKIKAGDFIVIPKNTYHSLNVTSTKPVKVISVQAPEFLGKDRVFKKEN